MPITSRCRKRRLARRGRRGRREPASRNSRTRARVSRIAAPISGVGRHLRRAQPVVADHAVLVRVGDRSPLERRHRGERALDRAAGARRAPARRSPCGSGRAGSRAPARRAAWPDSAPRAREGSSACGFSARHSSKAFRASVAPGRGPSDTPDQGIEEDMTHSDTCCSLAALLAASCGGGSVARRDRRATARHRLHDTRARSRSCATCCSSTTTGTRSCRTPTRRLRLARGLPRRRALPDARHHATATSPPRPRATPSSPTASSSASASRTSRRASSSCASRRRSPAARRPTPGSTAASTWCRSAASRSRT